MRHGGAEKVLATLLKNLPSDKYEIDLLLNLYSGKYLSEIPAWVNVLYLNKGEMITTNRPKEIPTKIYRVLYQGLLKKFPKLLYSQILKNKKYDVEIAANHSLIGEIVNSPIKSSKKIVWIHTDVFGSGDYCEAEIKKYLKADKILVISNKIASDFGHHFPERRNKFEKIYNPIDTAEIINLSEKSPFETQNYQSALPTFCAIGTVYPAKGFDRLLKVSARLIAENLPHQINIIGDGYDLEHLKALKIALKLQHVNILGFKENPYPHLRTSDFFVLSSRTEGFPTVLFEAITLNKNIIATDLSLINITETTRHTC